jgi:hypothetical protein
MQIPQQVLNTLAGTDVVLVPPESEGTIPTPAEEFVKNNTDALFMLGMVLAVSPTESALLFNPDFHDPDLINEMAKEDRLAEYVNGEGNNEKPIDPRALVKVTSRGEPVRDILVDDEQSGINAAMRNMTADNDVEILPASGEELLGTLESRGRRPQVEMPVPTIPQRADARNIR